MYRSRQDKKYFYHYLTILRDNVTRAWSFILGGVGLGLNMGPQTVLHFLIQRARNFQNAYTTVCKIDVLIGHISLYHTF